eukprot:TRINITY_DN5052_c0_g1_i1.p1 TRINITY_DN5052_c0_g1~~TRINITY_DN5052_c0_g1_i1.p1  ORF type:complete len:368 (-),score=45.51 TRINITY_DN5052_c0_g1_i1:655-1758(-)
MQMDRRRKTVIGVVSSLCAAFGFAVAALLVKFCSTALSTLDLLWGRAILQTVFLGLVFVARWESPWGPRELRKLLWARGLLGVSATVFYFIGIIALPLADSISIYSVKPVLAAVLAAVVLKEPFRCIHGFALILSLFGCVLVAQDRGHGADASVQASDKGGFSHIAAAGIILLAALLAAATSITTRHIMSRSTVRPEVPVWYFCIADFIVLSACSPLLSQSSFARRKSSPGIYHALGVVGIAAISVLAQKWMTLGLRYIPSALGTLLVQTETAHAFALQMIFYGAVSRQSLSGALLVCLATVALVVPELRQNSREVPEAPPHSSSHSSGEQRPSVLEEGARLCPAQIPPADGIILTVREEDVSAPPQ